MSTTYANQITETVKDSWTVRGTADVKYKGMKIAGGVGVTWSTSSDKILATPYDSSRNDSQYCVKYTFLDPLINTMNQEQKSFCKTQCIFYSAKSIYGSNSAMINYSFKTVATVGFKAYDSTQGYNQYQVASACAYFRNPYLS